MHLKLIQSRRTLLSAEQSRAEQSRAEQSRAEQSRAEQSRAEQSRAVILMLSAACVMPADCLSRFSLYQS
jgi:hypothetical protein